MEKDLMNTCGRSNKDVGFNKTILLHTLCPHMPPSSVWTGGPSSVWTGGPLPASGQGGPVSVWTGGPPAAALWGPDAVRESCIYLFIFFKNQHRHIEQNERVLLMFRVRSRGKQTLAGPYPLLSVKFTIFTINVKYLNIFIDLQTFFL